MGVWIEAQKEREEMHTDAFHSITLVEVDEKYGARIANKHRDYLFPYHLKSCATRERHYMRIIHVHYWEEEVQHIRVRTTHGMNKYSEFMIDPRRREMSEE